MSELINAIKQICEEKGLSYETVVETIESALAAAYRKDFGDKNQNVKVEFDPETMKSKVYDVKIIVDDISEEELAEMKRKKEKAEQEAQEEKLGLKKKAEFEPAPTEYAEGEEEKKRFNPKTEMQISDAKLIKKTAKIGEEVKMKLEIPESYGRMAAQTAKQVIIQRLREAERDMVFGEFKDKENEVITGVVQRREGRVVLVDLGKAVGILPQEEQIYNERYNPGDRLKIFVKAVNLTPKGAEIVLSRTSEEIIKKVFYLEIPEISNGLVELKSVAREAGARSKVAVVAVSDNIDPIGSCVGQRGARIQTIISELGGEKVDIIEYNEDPEKFIANALSPAKIVSIELNEKEKRAVVSVASDQLSLAIGKGGQNVRLAARLSGWKIDIIEKGAPEPVKLEETEEAAVSEEKETEKINVEENSIKDIKEEIKEEKKDKKKTKKEKKEE